MFITLLAGISGAAAAGLNAYLPLLVLALGDRFTDRIELGEPYDFISTPVGIIVLLLLLPVELIADKIPGVDHVSDLLHSAIRPAAAAFMMMAVTSERGDINALVALLVGLVIGVVVHGYKATNRPRITVASGGVGNPLVSMVEDAICGIVAIAVVLAPIALIAILPLSIVAVATVYALLQKESTTMRRLSGARP